MSEGKSSSTSNKTLCNVDHFVESRPLERWNSNTAIDDGLRQQPTVPIGISTVTYKLYKRRWVGLMQLALLNMLFGWNVCQINALSTF